MEQQLNTQTETPNYRVDVFFNQLVNDEKPNENGVFEYWTEITATSFPFANKKEAQAEFDKLVRTGYMVFKSPFGQTALRVEAVTFVNVKQEAEFNERLRASKQQSIGGGDLIDTLGESVNREQIVNADDTSSDDKDATNG